MNIAALSTAPNVSERVLIRDRPMRRGSLPLKKRRFLDVGFGNLVPHNTPSLSSVPGLPTLGVKTETSEKPSKIATLALVAATAAEEKPLKRLHHPPLAAPLPNGCHGRTSRNNSYCRRQPCYKGSNYCKLHYQQYIVAGNRCKEEGSDTSQEASPSPSPESVETTPVSTTKTTENSSNHQDRRYTGCGEETRCQATTTRGRACAYISVNGTKYCYLHADYDTNPPPRRGGGKRLLSPKGTVLLQCEQTVVRSVSDLGGDDLKTSSSTPSVTSEESSEHRATPTKKVSRRVWKQSDSPFPLLSMLSTDQWYNKKVKVSTGPLANRIGVVEKWGNGWVSVRIEGVGLHNRRSFELYLEQQQDAPEEELQDKVLRRCVSKDIDVSVEPPVKEEEEDKMSEAASKPAADEKKDDPAASELQSVVPESPIPCKPSSMSSSMLTSPVGRNGENQMELTKDGSSCGFTQSSLPFVSPRTPEPSKGHEMEEKPLVESLLLVQEGRGKRCNLDLLFGTAALERSRRTVHKPIRYEDKEMLERKRSRQNLEEEDSDFGHKRKRLESSPRSPRKMASFDGAVVIPTKEMLPS